MTNREILINCLEMTTDWVNQRDLQRDLIYIMNPESVAREARRLARAEVIEKRKNGKFVEYKLISSYSNTLNGFHD